MAFCSNCGQKLANDAKFCSYCGSPVGGQDNAKRNQVFEGNIHKCPNCGEIINAFTSRCPTCGFEFRDADASSAVEDFSKQLQEIESRRKAKSAFSGLTEALGVKHDDTDEQKINLIRSFSVPNTKEDVFEFMILASSNIDVSVYEGNEYPTEKRVSNAWIAKTEQVYHKAKLTFGNDPDFDKIQKIYDNKMKAVKKSKGKIAKILIGIAVFMVFDFWFIFYMADRESKKEAALENQLNETIAEIQQDISDGDYDDALIKAYGLHFDESLDKNKAKQWDEQREYLIGLINEKKGGN